MSFSFVDPTAVIVVNALGRRDRGWMLFAPLVSDGESAAAQVSVSASTAADPYPGR